jgi:hypothetical protein
MLGVVAAADPEQAAEVDAGSGGGHGIESVLGVDERADFLAGGGGGKDREQQRGAAGGGGSDDFGECAAREVELRDAAGDQLGRRLVLPVEVSTQEGMELLFRDDSAAPIFAFYSPETIFLPERGVGVNWEKCCWSGCR